MRPLQEAGLYFKKVLQCEEESAKTMQKLARTALDATIATKETKCDRMRALRRHCQLMRGIRQHACRVMAIDAERC